MGLFRRRVMVQDMEPTAIPAPRFSIDGWTLAGTPLGQAISTRLSRTEARELETLLHEVTARSETPYTYDRAATLLEHCDELPTALAVCEAWLDSPAAAQPEYAAQTRTIDKHRFRLRGKLTNRALKAGAAG